MFAALARGEDGQDVVEYGLLIAAICVVVLLSVAAYGADITGWLDGLGGRVTAGAPSGGAECRLPPGAAKAAQPGLEHGNAFNRC
jgi:Flp pilus assembly pilin Flp